MYNVKIKGGASAAQMTGANFYGLCVCLFGIHLWKTFLWECIFNENIFHQVFLWLTNFMALKISPVQINCVGKQRRFVTAITFSKPFFVGWILPRFWFAHVTRTFIDCFSRRLDQNQVLWALWYIQCCQVDLQAVCTCVPLACSTCTGSSRWSECALSEFLFIQSPMEITLLPLQC